MFLTIALISSIPEEGRSLIKGLRKKSFISGKPLCRGKINGREVVYMISGMGKVNASHAATVLIEKFSPRMIILFGVGGAYPSSGLEEGDIAVAEKEVYGDEGVLTGDGFRGTDFIGIPLVKQGGKRYFNEFPLNKKLVEIAVESSLRVIHPPLARGGKGGVKVKSGTFVTVSTCTGTRKRATELRKRFGAVCENMEGASVAHICALYGAPMIEIRGISNVVENRDKSKWEMRLAAENCQKVVAELLKRL